MPLLITTDEDESGKENAKESRRKWNKTGEPMIENSKLERYWARQDDKDVLFKAENDNPTDQIC